MSRRANFRLMHCNMILICQAVSKMPPFLSTNTRGAAFGWCGRAATAEQQPCWHDIACSTDIHPPGFNWINWLGAKVGEFGHE
jgi:hypothetical protein